MTTERHHILESIIGQLECELMLGGQWLPVGGLDLKRPAAASKAHPASRPGQRAAVPQKEAIITEKKGAVIAAEKETPEVKDKRRRLADVAERVSQCCECPLHELRSNTVPGEGNPDARLVFVGEAPGQNEDEQGRPFVGRAGKLLTNIIEAMGLKREDVFICNILKCRPPNNRDPQAAEIHACIGYLHEQLEIIEPDIIVALGAHAAQTLLDTTTAIGQLRGKIHEYVPHAEARPIKLVATYHPAYLLRSYTKDNRMRVWQDMQRVLRELDMPVPRGGA